MGWVVVCLIVGWVGGTVGLLGCLGVMVCVVLVRQVRWRGKDRCVACGEEEAWVDLEVCGGREGGHGGVGCLACGLHLGSLGSLALAA